MNGQHGRVLPPAAKRAILNQLSEHEHYWLGKIRSVRNVVDRHSFHPAMRELVGMYSSTRALFELVDAPRSGMLLLDLFFKAFKVVGKYIPPGMEGHALSHLEKALTEAVDYLRKFVR